MLSKLLFGVFLLVHLVTHFLRHTLAGRTLLLILLIVVLAGLSYREVHKPPAPDLETVRVHFPPGAGFSQITDTLIAHGLLQHETLFKGLARLSGRDRTVRAGLFELPKGTSPWRLLFHLERAPSAQISVTLPEGITAVEMASIFQSRLEIDSTAFIRCVQDSSLAAELLGGERLLEGYLLPETYFFEWGTPVETVIERLVRASLSIFEADSVEERMERIDLTRREVIVLASIVEGEAILDAERDTIASLYLNRLARGMPLQADPTIQFIISGPPRRLLNRDLEIDSPYNTYRHPGLPPGPINNPGRNSILAVIFPASTPFLYMVAAGDGSHRFSRTLREHNYWHARFNAIRRKVHREKRSKVGPK